MLNLGKLFQAMADPTRRKILEMLRAGDLAAGEIAEAFQMTKPAISHHLSVLKEANLVVDQRHGQNVIYRLNDDALSASMKEFFGQFRSCQQEMR